MTRSRSRLVVGAAAVAVAVASFLPAPGSAATNTAATNAVAPTIAAPASVRYWTAFTISGTATPSTTVTIYDRPAGSTFHLLGTVISDTAGNYSTTAMIAVTHSYYAVANGVRSATVVTTLPPTQCTISGPAFSKLPFSNYATPSQNPLFPSIQAFGALTANRSGLWAGIAFDGFNHFALVTKRAGYPLHVLDRFTYLNVSYDPGWPFGSVTAVGVLPDGSVLASVQPTSVNFESGKRVAYVYKDGVRRRLRGPPAWTSVMPVGVTPSGEIVGWFEWRDARGHLLNGVARWATGTSYPQVVVTTGADPSYPIVDGRGDISYYQGGHTWVRAASGTTLEMAGLPTDTTPRVDRADTATSFYGASDGPAGVQLVEWPVASLPSSGPINAHAIAPPSSDPYAALAGGHRQVLVGYPLPDHMLTTRGAYPKLPRILPVDVGVNSGESIDGHGSVAYTSRTDGLVHFFHCT